MQIQKLKINHYKTIEAPIEVTGFSNLHILIGPNNAGKTNVLDAIELFFNPSLDPDRYYDSRADLSLEIELRSKQKVTISQKEKHKEFLVNNKEAENAEEIFQEIQKRSIRIHSDDSAEKLIHERLKQFKENYPKDYAEFCGTLQQYFDDVEISEQLFLSHVKADRKQRSIHRMGDGFRRLFIMLFYIFHPDYDIILIDEPELHLHPSVIKKFLKILKDKSFKNQIFLTTHHSVFVQPEDIDHIWRVSRDDKRNTKVHTLADAKEALNIERLEQEINADNSEMFFADSVLLVEGVSDRILMRGLIDRFYHGDHDIKVIYASSKDNIDIYASVFEAFNIPFQVMLDRDALRGHISDVLEKALKGSENKSEEDKIEILKDQGIYVLPGVLEQNYPRRYRHKDDKKPINALRAAKKITSQDLNSTEMKTIKHILQSLHHKSRLT